MRLKSVPRALKNTRPAKTVGIFIGGCFPQCARVLAASGGLSLKFEPTLDLMIGIDPRISSSLNLLSRDHSIFNRQTEFVYMNACLDLFGTQTIPQPLRCSTSDWVRHSSITEPIATKPETEDRLPFARQRKARSPTTISSQYDLTLTVQ
jgi:hypothetical protein